MDDKNEPDFFEAPVAPPVSTEPTGDQQGDKKTKKAKQPKEPKPPKAAKEPKPDKSEKAEDTKVVAWPGPGKPTPLLVPKFIREKKAAERTARKVYYSVMAAALVVVALVAGSFLMAKSAENAKVQAETAQQGAQSRVDRLSGVSAYYDGLVQRQQTVVTTLQGELDYPAMLDGLYSELQGTDGVDIASVALAPAAACQGQDPFDPKPAIGCLNVNITANNPVQAAQYVSNLDDGEGATMFNSAFTTGFTAESDSALTVTVNYTADALSLRYVPEDQKQAVRDAAAAAAAAPAIDPATGQPVAGATGTTTPPATPAP